MSKAIAQSATTLAVSNGMTEETFDFDASCKRASERTAKGVTRERHLLQRNKIISMVCADYRSHFTAIYGKSDRLPTDIYAKIESAVDKYLAGVLLHVNPQNVISYRRAFHVNVNQLEVTEREILTGENKLALKEQRCGIVIFIEQAKKRLADLEKKSTPDYDREKELRAHIMRLETVKTFIDREISNLEKVQAETAAK